jgi:3-phenylpropionate/cinnamic acid dioxygenase small subunit
MSPDEIASHIEIGQLIGRYGLALDEKRFDDLDGVFRADAVLHYVMPDGSSQRASYEKWKPLFQAFLTPFYWTSHSFSDPVIALDGGLAESRCRLIAVHAQRTKSGEQSLWTVYGFYRDQLVRTNEGWRIRERRFRGVHAEGNPLPADRVESFPTLPFDA